MTLKVFGTHLWPTFSPFSSTCQPQRINPMEKYETLYICKFVILHIFNCICIVDERQLRVWRYSYRHCDSGRSRQGNKRKILIFLVETVLI